MRKIAYMAAVAVLVACPAFAIDSVTATIAGVDTKNRAILLDDKTVMLVDDSVNLDALKSGMKVVVVAKIDEDGYSRATAVNPTN